MDLYSLDTPLGSNAPGGYIVSDINVPDLGDTCRITQVRLSLYFTDPLLSSNGMGASVSHTAYTFGVRVLWDPLNLTGTSIGTSCADVTFQQGTAPPFPGEPPYSGVYSPVGSLTSPQFSGFIGTNPAGTWTLRMGEASASGRLQCWRLQLQLAS